MSETVRLSSHAIILCPGQTDENPCNQEIEDRELRAVISPEIYQTLLDRSLAEGELNLAGNVVHCLAPDCKGFAVIEGEMESFQCPVCLSENCLRCQQIHEFETCDEHQQDKTKRTESELNEEFIRGEIEKGDVSGFTKCHLFAHNLNSILGHAMSEMWYRHK